ncbi:hypothetical protein [Salinimonas chungwhensis]|uniref:hypothetical protein n=1 Tax=Salinimonas chungwhensis TaxID=265425 RepID=UPI0003631F14|nr:hypothetical protein [Salinimonas chungwhensis]
MTLNQLPAYATSLVQAQRETHVSTEAIPRTARIPSGSGLNTDAEGQREHSHQNARAYHDALRSSRRRRKYDTPQVLRKDSTVTSLPERQWKNAAAEEKRCPSTGIYTDCGNDHNVDATIQQLRDKALMLQLVIMNNPGGFFSATSRTLLERLKHIQHVLQREVEHEAERLRHYQPNTDRCGNLIDEVS